MRSTLDTLSFGADGMRELRIPGRFIFGRVWFGELRFRELDWLSVANFAPHPRSLSAPRRRVEGEWICFLFLWLAVLRSNEMNSWGAVRALTLLACAGLGGNWRVVVGRRDRFWGSLWAMRRYWTEL
jgi:hypothetical protein